MGTFHIGGSAVETRYQNTYVRHYDEYGDDIVHAITKVVDQCTAGVTGSSPAGRAIQLLPSPRGARFCFHPVYYSAVALAHNAVQ